MIVAKFGGSSVKDAAAMKRCYQIVKDQPETGLVILSATYNTTNELEQLAQTHSQEIFDHIDKKHKKIAEDLGIWEDVQPAHEKLMRELSQCLEFQLIPEIMDSIYSIGERISSRYFYEFLKKELTCEVELLDARDFLVTDDHFGRAQPIISEIAKRAQALKQDKLYVTQGFIGSTLDGKTTTLGREGSDFSAALFAEALNADLLQIWTDAPGIATADPKIVKDVFYHSHLHYDEAALLAEKGAKVLFPQTMEPAKRKHIPIMVGSSIEPARAMTTINHEKEIQTGWICICHEKFNDFFQVTVVGYSMLDNAQTRSCDESLDQFDNVVRKHSNSDVHVTWEVPTELATEFIAHLHKFIK